MKTKSKALLLALCAAALVVATVFGTMAYLTDTKTVTNTFTVGSVNIKLDEAKVTLDGTPDGDMRVESNSYKLIPGHTYIKDPTVQVAGGSEDSWIFVKVENDLAAYEAKTVAGDYQTIADQILANGWKKLNGVDGVNNVYYQEYTNSPNDTDFNVFGKFKIADNANDVDGWENIATNNKQIVITAYAVQKDGFDNAADAWAVVNN